MDAITLDEMSRTDIENLYWCIDESIRYCSESKTVILYRWKNVLADEYSRLFGSNEKTRVVFKDEDYHILVDVANIGDEYVSHPRTDMAKKILRALK